MDNNDPQQGAVEIQPVIKQEPPVMADHGAIGNHIQPQAPAQPQAQAQAQVVIDLGDEDAGKSGIPVVSTCVTDLTRF